jgi:hypothetical protein
VYKVNLNYSRHHFPGWLRLIFIPLLLTAIDTLAMDEDIRDPRQALLHDGI